MNRYLRDFFKGVRLPGSVDYSRKTKRWHELMAAMAMAYDLILFEQGEHSCPWLPTKNH